MTRRAHERGAALPKLRNDADELRRVPSLPRRPSAVFLPESCAGHLAGRADLREVRRNLGSADAACFVSYSACAASSSETVAAD